MIEKTLYGQHYDRVHALWERACLGLKCMVSCAGDMTGEDGYIYGRHSDVDEDPRHNALHARVLRSITIYWSI